MPWFSAGSSAGTVGSGSIAGIAVKGSVATAGTFPTGAKTGDAYITRDTGHIWVYDGSTFIDAGNIVGPAGPAPTLTQGTTTTLAAGADPTFALTKVGTTTYRLDFGLPAGSSDGGGGKQAFTHIQASAATQWIFTHDLPFEPGGMRITDWDQRDARWNAAVTYDSSSKQFTLTFPVNVRGEVTIS